MLSSRWCFISSPLMSRFLLAYSSSELIIKEVIFFLEQDCEIFSFLQVPLRV